MSKNTLRVPRARRAATLCVLLLLFAWSASAQSTPQVSPPGARPSPTPEAKSTPTAKPTPTLERRFFRNILRDQGAIWTSPLRAGRGDAKWLAPLGLSAAVLFSTDRHTAGEMIEGGDNSIRLRISRDISRGGSLYSTGAVAAAFYLFGRGAHNARARETGLLGAEALVDSGLVVEALKLASQRQRPPTDHASGEFFSGGSSFPSGHSISAWSLATVIAKEYGRRRPLVQVGVYGLATAVSLSRFTGRNHFLSDVLVGSALGYGIGRFVYFKHHDRSLDAQPGGGVQAARSKLIPMVAPQIARGARGNRVYGLRLAWDF
jgi:membrane-associated phospholipid phosphatase